jgi:hypothetical protein
MGRFVYTVMLAMGEYFLETIKAGWVTAKSKAIARGAHIGPTPFGYQRNDDGTLVTDPTAGPIVSEAFAICARDGLAAAIDFRASARPTARGARSRRAGSSPSGSTLARSRTETRCARARTRRS